MDTFIEIFIMNFKEFLSLENHKHSVNFVPFFGARGHLNKLRRTKTRNSCCFNAYCERFADASK